MPTSTAIRDRFLETYDAFTSKELTREEAAAALRAILDAPDGPVVAGPALRMELERVASEILYAVDREAAFDVFFTARLRSPEHSSLHAAGGRIGCAKRSTSRGQSTHQTTNRKEPIMATRLYGISRGEGQEQIAESVGAATTDSVELTIDLAVGLTREEVVVLLDRITRYILEHDFPPA